MGDAVEARAWPAAIFNIATPNGVEARSGYVWCGLGIYKMRDGSPAGRRKAEWSLTHLGTGHLIAVLTGDVATVFPVASEVASAGDWTFDGLTGWRNQFPDCQARVREIIARYPKIIRRPGVSTGMSEEQARKIAIARETVSPATSPVGAGEAVTKTASAPVRVEG